MIIDDQHPQSGDRGARLGIGGRGVRITGRTGQWHADVRTGAFTVDTVQRQAAAHDVAQVAADCQAQARTTTCQLAVRIGLGEWQEEAVLILLTNTDAAVLHGQLQARGA
ncbi:hypothetical protein D9M71_701850 [compost metagenome]